MLYNVSQLLKEGVGASRQHSVDGELYDLDVNNPGPVPVRGHVLFVRIPRGILVTGQVELELTQTCRRCLELARNEVTLEIEEEYIPSIDIEPGATLPITAEDAPELVISEQPILDLTEVLRQLAVAQITGLGLCRPDCKGLCPTCGKNLNEGACDCDTRLIDPRLAALAALLDQSELNDKS